MSILETPPSSVPSITDPPGGKITLPRTLNRGKAASGIRNNHESFLCFWSLVTNDRVAELVKNCYDAFAYNVTVKITSDSIRITDDGIGMTEDIIRNAWAIVATSSKKAKPTVERDGEIRKVSGYVYVSSDEMKAQKYNNEGGCGHCAVLTCD